MSFTTKDNDWVTHNIDKIPTSSGDGERDHFMHEINSEWNP